MNAGTTAMAIRPPGLRWSCLMLGLAVLAAGFGGLGSAIAQQTRSGPSAAPLPSVIYPLGVPDQGAENLVPPAALPPALLPPPTIVEGDSQYVLVDGVWGYWDRDRRFHRTPDVLGRPSTARPPGVVSLPGHPVSRRAVPPSADNWRPTPRSVSRLPNPTAGRIVGAENATLGRSPGR
jgi:hypothetical protein